MFTKFGENVANPMYNAQVLLKTGIVIKRQGESLEFVNCCQFFTILAILTKIGGYFANPIQNENVVEK